MAHNITRRHLMKLGASAAVASAALRLISNEDAGVQAAAGSPKYSPIYKPLDAFTLSYMQEMNSPGMTLGLADRSGTVRTSVYGFDNLDSKKPVQVDQLFQIGSISKSFAAIALLQLRDEGKLDLNKPITEYLPWLAIESSFAPITVHHLLTHSSGLPSGSPLPLPAGAKLRAAYPPGEHFHYCNFCFHVLGFLISTLDGRPFPAAIKARIFDRVGMSQSQPLISSADREHQVTSYVPLHDDRPYPRYGALVQAPWIVSDDAAGSICSTAGDMTKYMTVIANRGKLASGRLMSEEAFALFSKPHIAAEEFGPGVHYGYGIAVDMVDGNTVLRHTGGMISFMSSIQVNIDRGVGAFASVNAQQGYRPNPVAAYAIKLMRAVMESKPTPAAPEPNPQFQVKNASDYAGTYTAPDGRVLQAVASGDALFLLYNGERVKMQQNGGDNFIALHRDLELFPVVFGREKSAAKPDSPAASGVAPAPDAPRMPVVDLAHGSDWYAGAHFTGDRNATPRKDWEQFLGHYHSDNPWEGSFRVVERQGKLFLDGVVELKPLDDRLFRVMDEDPSPEWILFGDVVNGKTQSADFSNSTFRRVEA